ncbi:MAG: hypothetical protein ACXACG_04685, partial [Candidatus Thorarchaeota archaeon]
TIFLTLILSPMTSSLTVIGNLSDRVDIEEPTSVKLLYALSNGTPISGANVVVDSVSPSSGLDKTAVTEVGGEPGNYTVTLTPYSATVYTVRFVATGPISEPASTVFVLVVNDVETGLMIYGDSSLEIGLTETYNTTFRYEMINGTGIETADIDVVYSGPIGMLTWNKSEYGVGNYSIAFVASLPGAYIITLVAFKQYHQRASDSFSLIIRDIPTNLTLSVGTSDEMGLTDTYEMSFVYEMYNGTGIEDATIKVIHSGAPSAITSLVTPLGLGNYSIQFNATISGGFLVTIAASKQYHQGSSNSFLLVVREITASMVSLNGTGDFVGFGKDYRLFMSYTNGSGYGLVGANVSVVDADAGIAWSPTQIEAPGVYSILLTPLTSGSLSVIVHATLLNHEIGVVFFTLTVTAIPTTLTTLNLSTSISADQNFTVYLQYQDEDTTPLENATLGILNPPPQLIYSSFEELGNGVYRVTLTPLSIGTFDIVFSSSKAGYQTDYTGFTLSATIIQTDLNVADDLISDTITYSDQYNLFVLYTRTDSGYNVTDATIRIESPSIGLSSTVVEEVDGGYTIILDPQKSGNWTIYIFASRDNHEESSTLFRLEVEPISISVEFVSELSAMENIEFGVTVKLTEFGTNNTIDDALVWYRFSVSNAGLFREMNSTGVPGEYAVRLSVPLYANSIYRLEISVEKENYRLSDIPDTPFIITPNVIERNSLLIVSSSGVGISLVIFFVALRIFTRKKKAQIEVDIVNKRRFDDADNIIGVIVMHKKSGIPVYSRIVKGGFEEGIVAAFISAVTHFREEFEMFDEEAMTVIPISDIIRAVQTKNLICAFITIRSASMEHNRKMEDYGMQVASYLDDFYTESRPTGVLDTRIAEILDYVFDETMDGNLIKFYKVGEEQQFPRRYRNLEQLLEDIESRHCARPVHLAQGVATFGVSEAHGCTLVLEAIEKRLIMQCDDHEPTVEDMEFADFFNKKNGNDKD